MFPHEHPGKFDIITHREISGETIAQVIVYDSDDCRSWKLLKKGKARWGILESMDSLWDTLEIELAGIVCAYKLANGGFETNG